jgi:DNA processing protein
MDISEQIVKLLSISGVGRKSTFSLLESVDISTMGESELWDYLMEKNGALPRLKLTPEKIKKGFELGKSRYDQSLQQGIKFIHYKSPFYPKILMNSQDPPVMLSYIGNIENLASSTVAIIGTREPSDYGYKIGLRLGEYFSEKNYSVVSGLARGCDTAAHRGCLNASGRTVAVLAHGLNTIYPKENKVLAEEIVDRNGLLVSEYFVGQPPLASFFVERDRIQAGLSLGVFVIETGVNGGTLHTVGFCEGNKRPVGCFNHPMEFRTSDKALGNQMLILSSRGIPIYSEEELLFFLDKMETTDKGPNERKTSYRQGSLWE